MRASDAKLHDALMQAGLPELAQRAAASEFNDFFSDRATPKAVLVDALDGHDELIERVVKGEFDSGREEGREWVRSPQGQRSLAQLSDATPVTDPREMGGEIAGPGGPFDWGQTILDASRALLASYTDICKVDAKDTGQSDAYAILFYGRVNRSDDDAKVMVVGGLDFLAGLIVQCHGVAERAGMNKELHKLCAERWQEMPH